MVSDRFVSAPATARTSSSSWLVRIAVSTALANAALATPVFAQETQETLDEVEEVTVTGSRILRRDLTASSPVVTVQTEQLEQSSTTAVESVLQQLPQF